MTNSRHIDGHEAEVLLYQTNDGHTRVEVRFDGETAWLSLGQLTELFQRDKSVISRHIKNIFDEGELSREATVAEFATVQREGDREVTRDVEYFNLDHFLSLSERKILQHAGRVTHEAAVAKAELEYDRFATARVALPSLPEKHFEEAVSAVKQLDRRRSRRPMVGKK